MVGALDDQACAANRLAETAMENVLALFGDRVAYASSVRECVSQSSLCVIMTPSDEFRAIDASHIGHNPTMFLDCWRILDASQLGEKARYIALGAPVSEW